ncbi:hypothetical protein BDZ97DRAFT_326735 [Flammula alnicola]|nr:hypothetical protein BDZ97DRAFT_326735 [Flammula alnicola]
MIPRTARKLETTLLSSRQALPRPARLYSTPSKPHNAPATATATATAHPSPHDFHLFQQISTPTAPDISNFLSRGLPLTIIPAPEPVDSKSTALDPWFPDSQSHDMVGIIDACLHNLHDVNRARDVFGRLRQRVGSAALTIRIYNAFLDAYLGMARKEDFKKKYWVDEAWQLYEVVEKGAEGVQPTPKTYSIMLSALQQYGPHSTEHLVELAYAKDTEYLLSKIVEREIPVMEVATNSYLKSPQVMADIVKMLSSVAFNLGFKDTLKDLGHIGNITHGGSVLDDVPEIIPVQVLSTKPSSEADGIAETEAHVPFNIEALRRHLTEIIEARSVLDNDLSARQKHLESSVYDLALEQLEHRDKVFKDNFPRSPDLQHWIWMWHTRMEEHLKQIIKAAQSVASADRKGTAPSVDVEEEEELELEEGTKKRRKGTKRKQTPEQLEAARKLRQMQDILPCLVTIPTHKLSLLTILELLRMQGNGGVINGMKTTAALITVGKAVENEFKMEVCKQSKIPVANYSIKRGNYFTNMGYKHLHERRLAAAKSQELDEKWQSDWSQAMRSKVGAFLVNSLESVAEVTRMKVDPATGKTLTENQPAIFNSYEFVRGHKLGVIKFNDAVCERMAKDSLARTIHARHLPMLVKPKPWINYNDGGYLYNKSSAMRFKDSLEQEVYLREATNAGTVELVYAGLDILGSTPWNINKGIFDVVVKVWNSGERMGKIPPAQYDEPEPVLEEGKEGDMQAKTNYIMRHKVWSQGKANNHSDRCSVNYKVEIARAFLGDTIYMPHNLDFRGRAYPIPPHLNHIGDDLSRALLFFSEGKPLGVRGLRWLKIHAANLYGYDKANFEERVAWVEEHLDQINESATNPLEGSRWWTKADDPWQFLATCMELTKALKLEDPTTYVCQLPVHQDGTCNGLQHYAALGGDAQGAQQVNLLASDRPSDVYTHISLSVEEALAVDAEAGNEMAKLLTGKIARKVVKQTVMTTVYGVTFIGAREQIERQLKDRGDIPQELIWGASSYLARKVLDTIGDAFRGARSIQDWLNICARLITKSIPEKRLALKRDEEGKEIISLPMKQIKKEQMTSVIWTTALGLPIVQPYRKTVRKQIKTQMQSVYISDPYASSEVNSIKQASAFPPNFIHSLDATHMLLTALECRNRNLFFASVHDSYWTHACDVDEMSEVIRETFIALHSSDILGRLEKEFRERYSGHQVPLEHLAKLGSSRLLKMLKHAGCRIYAHRDQAQELRAIKELVVFSDDKTSIAATADVDSDADSSISEETISAKEIDEEVEEDGEEMSSGDENKAADIRLLAGKFVRLSDLFPPLPSKGTFQVENIKASPYFFS